MGQKTARFTGGVMPVAASSQEDMISFRNTWLTDDWWSVRFITTEGNFVVGRATDDLGNPVLAGTEPTFGLTYAGRVYLANGTKYNFSDNNDPTGWLEQNPGAGFVQLLIHGGGQDTVQSLSSYQGRLAAFLRNSIQIWATDADPALFALKQTLPNIGTNYGFSVQSVGDWDVLFLADSGVRSLRVRDESLNAETVDSGAPIDSLVQAVLQGVDVGTPVAVVDPAAQRYWLFLKDTIYVLASYRTLGIQAWSTYKPTYKVEIAVSADEIIVGEVYHYIAVDDSSLVVMQGAGGDDLIGAGGDYISGAGDAVVYTADTYFVATSTTVVMTGGQLFHVVQRTFVPTKFVVKDGRVVCRATVPGYGEYLITYGGGYDNCVADIKSPYYSLQSPSLEKFAHGVDLAITGSWDFLFSTDQDSATFETVGALTKSTYDCGMVSIGGEGTHFAFRLQSSKTSFAKCVLSSISPIFTGGDVS
jgi:hypothetical protein